MSRKVKKWLRSYPSAGRLENMDFATFSLFLHGGGRCVSEDGLSHHLLFSYKEVGDEQKSEERTKKLAEWC